MDHAVGEPSTDVEDRAEVVTTGIQQVEEEGRHGAEGGELVLAREHVDPKCSVECNHNLETDAEDCVVKELVITALEQLDMYMRPY